MQTEFHRHFIGEGLLHNLKIALEAYSHPLPVSALYLWATFGLQTHIHPDSTTHSTYWLCVVPNVTRAPSYISSWAFPCCPCVLSQWSEPRKELHPVYISPIS